MKRKILFAVFSLALLASAFAEDAPSSGEKILSDETVEKLKDGGTQFLLDMQSAFQKAGNALDKQLKSTASKVCVGSWQFVNGKCTTTVSCLNDGSMEVVQKNSTETVSWRGTYEANLTQIKFSAVSRTATALFFKKNESIKENWVFEYRIPTEGTIRLSSDSLPDDANGYDFSNPTLFTKI